MTHIINRSLITGIVPSKLKIAMTKFTDYILNSVNSNKYVIGMFLDLAKAFDIVDHKILLK